LRAGRYAEAIALARNAPGGGGGAAARTLVRALAETGSYPEAESAARAAAATSPDLLVDLGQVLAARGERAAADSAFVLALARAPGSRLVARLERARLQWQRGAKDSARAAFRAVHAAAASAADARSLVAAGDAARFLGSEDPGLFKDALRLYDRAAALDGTDPLPRLRAGELFLEKYNGEDAQQSFREVLGRNPRQPDALVGMARVLEFDARPGAAQSARQALATNPRHVGAHLLLARLALENEDYAAAEKEVSEALAVNVASLEALAVLGATRYLHGDPLGLEAAWRRASALDPRYADFFTTAAELGVRGRQYGGAVELARRALALDSTNAAALGVLGVNLLRQGDMAGGRAALEKAFARDPYNVWYKNTLDLLDQLKTYRETRTADFQLVVSSRESQLLAPYAGELAEEAYHTLATRYGYRPSTPVRLEIYPREADFSVRTVGLVGLGALGVTFGRVVAMDSPGSRERGDFNWGSTLWHELAHVFHLGMTDARVPRW
ncbi:MAG TPA: tetratricopeptide repeat protein, partial [Longimicrobiales bacterium]